MTFHDAIVQALVIRAEGIKTEVTAMLAHDTTALQTGGGLYTEEAYANKAQQLYSISNEIQSIARSGVFQ